MLGNAAACCEAVHGALITDLYVHAHAGKLKQECTVLVVSHDLREVEPLVDLAWEMEAGGRLRPVPWPPR